MGCGCGKKKEKGATATGNATAYLYEATLRDGTKQTFDTRSEAIRFTAGKGGSTVRRVSKVPA